MTTGPKFPFGSTSIKAVLPIGLPYDIPFYPLVRLKMTDGSTGIIQWAIKNLTYRIYACAAESSTAALAACHWGPLTTIQREYISSRRSPA